VAAADNVAYLDASGVGWHAMGSGGGACGCAVNDFVRSLTAVGTNVYVGTDALDVAGIAQADKVARWNGSAWSAVGANTAGTDGWFPPVGSINGLSHDGTNVYATGSFQNANGDPTADFIASFDGTSWHAVGSDGAGNGPFSGIGLTAASFLGRLFVGGNFTSAGGDTQAKYLAAYPGDYQLTVTLLGQGSLVEFGSPPMTCPPQCSATFAPGTVVNPVALTYSQGMFDGWGGACSGLGGCSVTMDSDKTVTETSHAIPYCFSESANLAGEVTSTLQLKCQNNISAPLVYGIESAPAHGTLGVPDAAGKVSYTPKPGFSGQDLFHYVATSTNGVARYAIFVIQVAPVTTPPRVSKASQTNAVWRPGGALATFARAGRPIGTIFSLDITQQARVTLAFTQRITTHKSRHKRQVTRGTLSFAGHSGVNTVHFQGRISGSKKLKPGRYKVIITAVNAEHKRSASRSLSFTIVK
jgi:hypothetical protein